MLTVKPFQCLEEVARRFLFSIGMDVRRETPGQRPTFELRTVSCLV